MSEVRDADGGEGMRKAKALRDAEGKISRAVEIALECGGYDGEHHKQWVIDQMLRVLLGDGYALVLDEVEGWEEGIAP